MAGLGVRALAGASVEVQVIGLQNVDVAHLIAIDTRAAVPELDIREIAAPRIEVDVIHIDKSDVPRLITEGEFTAMA